MLTGTPLDLTKIPELLQLLGIVVPIVWLLLLIGSLVMVWLRVKTKPGRVTGTMVVLVILVVLPLLGLTQLRRESQVIQAKQDTEQAELSARYEKAEALFKKRCETAGEFIHRTIPDVRGVVWMKWRPEAVNDHDQFKLDDPYGRDCGGEDCIRKLLRSTFVVPNRDMNNVYLPAEGYEFVETRDPRDEKLYRYTAGVKAVSTRTPEERAIATKNNHGVDPGSEVFKFDIQREAINQTTARFGITWDDLSTHEDRENWIAGGSLSVLDLKTNEVLATRVGYMMDRGLGSSAGFRSPWLFASHHDCRVLTVPSFKREQWRETSDFVFKALQPTKGETK
jgi:hypothetical protein